MSRIRNLANLFSGNTDSATDAEVTAAISAHNNTTTSVHGIADTSRISTFDSSVNVPGAPTSISASTGNAQATVTFTAPADNGGSDILGYVVTSSPGNIKKAGTSSPITITGLTNNTAYTFTVVATNIKGSSAASSASNSVTPINGVVIDYLVIAGGGGGGVNSSPGGGAGGYRTNTGISGGGASAENSMVLAYSTNFPITVGAGGAGGVSPAGYSHAPGAVGSNSVFNGITSIGGGGAKQTGSLKDGGSGGGGGGLGTAGQGYNAGTIDPSGGGGAGGLGGNLNGTFPTSGTSGAGGAGVASTITGTSVIRASGGGGAGDGRGTATAPATPGGGGAGAAASYGSSGNPGTANTGGGGGGGSFNSGTQGNGGNGGSGIVIISAPQAATATTGSPTVTTSGGRTIYQFTASGSITF